MKRFVKCLFILAAAAVSGLASPIICMADDAMKTTVLVIWPYDAEGKSLYNEQGFNATAGVGISDGQSQLVITSATAAVEGAVHYTVENAMTGSETEGTLIMADAEKGFALFGVGQNLTDYPFGEIREGEGELSNGDRICGAGLDVTIDGTVQDMVSVFDSTIAEFVKDSSGNRFVRMADVFTEGYIGGPVFTVEGDFSGIMTNFDNNTLFITIQDITAAVTNKESGGGGTPPAEGSSGSGENGTQPEEGNAGGGTQPQEGSGDAGGSKTQPTDGTAGNNGTGASGTGGGGSAYAPPYGTTMDDIIFAGMPPGAVKVYKFFRAMIFPMLIVLMIAGGLYIQEELRRKNRGTGEFDETVKNIVGESLSIVGTGGRFNRKRFPVTTSVTIGRDGKHCQILYPEGAGGISSVHCRVSLENMELKVMDLGSTYGTFLRDGTRLKPNVPYTLHRGDSFYLAEASNSFCVM